MEPPTVAVMKAGAAAGLAGKGQTPAMEAVKLQRIRLLRKLRGCTDLGLKEAKEVVGKAPVVFKKGVTKEEAEKIIEKMKGVGAKVVMKGD
ncbi:uncharacterized protein [Rutidosis leptorrhynchoides]|uniref:uncharacterized protein n=1 Tax=Rutidosis leptorrhynchoides TaxID=125765 RepID=UPI003A99DB27